MATTLESLLEALGWQGGTIHDALSEARKLKARVSELEAYQKEAEEALKLSGKLSMAAFGVIYCDARNLSSRIETLSKAYQEYDNHIIQWTLSQVKKA
jgi:phage portal protein BeeE